MQYPYVGSDLDGTIVKNDNLRIIEATVYDILEYQKTSGDKFFIVTGRMYEAMKYYIHQLQIKIPVISCNGAVITDPKTGKVLFQKSIDKNISKKLIEFAIEKKLDLIFYTSTSMVVLKESERANLFQKNYGDLEEKFRPNLTFLNSYEEMLERTESGDLEPVKFLFSFYSDEPSEKHEETLKYLKYLDLYFPTTVINDRFLIDAMQKGITKANGIIEWAKIMNVNVEDIHVIGDNNNDIEMIQQAKFGVAVANGVPALLECAKIIVDSINENGVGKYLRNLINAK